MVCKILKKTSTLFSATAVCSTWFAKTSRSIFCDSRVQPPQPGSEVSRWDIVRHGPPIYHSFTHDCLSSCDHFAICTSAIISIQGSSAYWGFTTLLCFCFSSVLLCFCFSSALLCLLLHLSLCVCLFSACRLLFASLTQFCYFLHFYHFFPFCSRDVT